MNEIIWGRYSLLVYTAIVSLFSLTLSIYIKGFLIVFVPSFLLFLISLKDFVQKKRSILSNFPILGRFRFFLESIRPELRQYYWESDDDEVPYSRNQRTMVYERSKNEGGVRSFGSLEIFYENDEQKKEAEEVLNEKNKEFNGKIKTNISKIKNYCKAEQYHQKYIEKNKR